MKVYNLSHRSLKIECIPTVENPTCTATWGKQTPQRVEVNWPGPEYYRDKDDEGKRAVDLLAVLHGELQVNGLDYRQLIPMCDMRNYTVTEIGKVDEEWILDQAFAQLLENIALLESPVGETRSGTMDQVDALLLLADAEEIVESLKDERLKLANIMDPFYVPKVTGQMDLF